MSSLTNVMMQNAHRLTEFVEPTVQWCGTENCLHRGSEHHLNNRCLVCGCPHFSTRKNVEDIATALKFLL